MFNFILLLTIIIMVCFNIIIIHPQMIDIGPCNICLILCDLQRNSPKDFGTLHEGLELYFTPPRNKPLPFNQVNQLQGSEITCSYTANDFTSLLNSISRITKFYERNVQGFNQRQDGGVGLMTLQNTLAHGLRNDAGKLSASLVSTFSALLNATSHTQPKIFEYSIQNVKDEARIEGLKILMNNPALLSGTSSWMPYKSLAVYKNDFNNIGHEKEVIYSFLDFQCLVALADACSVPTVCKKMYLEEPYSQYMLLHQVLYLQIAEKRGCTATSPEFKNWLSFRHQLCSKAYLEAEYLAAHDFPIRWRDLFSEQVAFCSLAGYSNFMRSDWLAEILSWESKSMIGCYPNIYGDVIRTTDAIIHVDYSKEADHAKSDKEGVESIHQTEEDCLVHFTSVSLAALAMNLRFMIDNCPSSVMSPN